MNFTFISLIIIIVFSFSLVFGLIVPKYNSVLEMRQKVTQSKTELVDYRGLIAKSEEYLAKLTELSQDVKKINLALPPRKDESAVVASIEKFVSNSGLILKDIDIKIISEKLSQKIISEEFQEKKYQTAIINLTLSGDYNLIKSFLSALEKNMPIMNLVSLDIIHEKEDILLYNLIIETYYLSK